MPRTPARVMAKARDAIVSAVTRLGLDPADSSELRLRKALLVAVALMVLPAGLIWGALYWIFGERVTALIPWGYVAGSLASLLLFRLTRSFELLRTLELLLILIAPFLVMVSLGGFTPSSGVILWSLLAPLGAIVFDDPRRAWRWFGAYVGLLVVGTPVAAALRSTPTTLPDEMVLVFGGMNIGAPSLVAFVLLATFASQREAAQQRVEDLLLNILPRPIAERLKAERRRIADDVDQASILFADVVDFTPLAARLPAAGVVDLLDGLFTEFDELAERHGLEKIKTIGDCYMVAAGVPTPRPDHALAVSRMAVDMAETVRRHARDDGTPLELRIGINSGSMVAGVIGRKRFIYDLWGDAVNTASRMESQGSAGRIQITRATYELVRDEFECVPHGAVEVKGKGAMETWFLIGPRTGQGGTREVLQGESGPVAPSAAPAAAGGSPRAIPSI